MNAINIYQETSHTEGSNAIFRSTETTKANSVISKNTTETDVDVYEHKEPESVYHCYTSKGSFVDIATEKAEQKKFDANLSERTALPERYNKKTVPYYTYYQGKHISGLELLQIAVDSGAITLDESKSVFKNYIAAEEALIQSKAKPLYDWSTTLYSEDGKFIYRAEGGIITGCSTAVFHDEDGNEVTLQDMARQLASGVKACDVKGDVGILMRMDRELYDAACAIGNTKRIYEQTTEAYHNGQLNRKQYLHDLYPVFLLLYGNEADIYSEYQLKGIDEFFSGDGFLERAFAKYNPENFRLFNDLLTEKGYHAYSGMY